MKSLLILGVGAAALLLGCGTDDGTSSAGTATAPPIEEVPAAVGDLTGTSWVLESFIVAGQQVPVAAEATATFDADGMFAGSTGCNRITGTWEQDGDSVSIDVGATTQVACTDQAVAEQEEVILAVLPEVMSAQQVDDTLSLLDADGAALLTYAAGLADLADTSWTAIGVNNQTGAVESTELTSTATADFAADGTVSGFTGCREFTGSWQTDGDTITLTDVTAEGDECTGDEATLEERYLAALEASSTFAIEGGSLNLRDSDGATQVNYTLATS